jgi:hypothetical protein
MTQQEILDRLESIGEELPDYRFCSLNVTSMKSFLTTFSSTCNVTIFFQSGKTIGGKGPSIETAILDLQREIAHQELIKNSPPETELQLD